MAQQLVKVDREAVRLLAIEFGVREAARRSGLNESTVKSWSTRDKWFVSPPVQPFKSQIAVASIASRPGDILLDEIRNNERETRVSLSRSCKHMAKQAETADLEVSGDVHKVAQTFAILHPPEQNKSTILNLGILIGQSPVERDINEKVIDVSPS